MRLYKEIETVFRCESYMSCVIQSALRVNYTKLRLSSHKFLVDRTRWSKVLLVLRVNLLTFSQCNINLDTVFIKLIKAQRSLPAR